MKYSITPVNVDDLAGVLTKVNPVEIVTPQNITKVKTDWLAAAKTGFTNPVFSYKTEGLLHMIAHDYVEFLEDAAKQFIAGIKPETGAEAVILSILNNRIQSGILCAKLSKSIIAEDDEETARITRIIYGHPSNIQIIRAYDITNGDIQRASTASRFTKREQKKLKDMSFNAADVEHWFKETLRLYNITGWDVEVSSSYTCVDVRDRNSYGRPIVGIPYDKNVDGMKLLELIGHEIESHLRSSENCRSLIRGILGSDSPLEPLVSTMAKSDDELLYEGAAKISDVSINGSSALPMPFATIACNQAARGASFAETASIICDRFIEMKSLEGEPVSEQEAFRKAWVTTYRIFRGATDTTKGHCCFPKDYIYMCGYDVAQNINPAYLEFSSMTINEIAELAKISNLRATYRKLDAVSMVKNNLLA